MPVARQRFDVADGNGQLLALDAGSAPGIITARPDLAAEPIDGLLATRDLVAISNGPELTREPLGDGAAEALDGRMHGDSNRSRREHTGLGGNLIARAPNQLG